MRRALLCTLFCLLAAPMAQAAVGLELNLNLLVGQKQMNDGDWKNADLDTQLNYGLMADINVPVVPFAFALDILTSSDDTSDLEGETYEIQAGIRKYFGIVPVVTPYAGVGVSYLQAELSEDGDSVDGDGYGYWFDVGVVYVIAEHINVGLDIRYSSGEVDLEDNYGDVDAGGWMYGVFAGFHF